MTPVSDCVRPREWGLVFLVAAVAALVAILSARPCAGSWNDGSRLASVESLVERGTLVIDDSIYLDVPSAHDPDAPSPYDPAVPALQCGTGDRILVNGHYYSHKSPVPSVLMAGLYAGLRQCGLTAREHPGWFAWSMCVGASGAAYVFAVVGVFLLGGALGLSARPRLALAAALAFATTALNYSRQVNDHILLLALVVWLLLGMTRLVRQRPSALLLVGLGSLAGLAYAVEMGAGPLLLLCAFGFVALHCRGLRPVAVFCLAALPWVGLHHALNYGIGGTLVPAASVPEFFRWPGSHFDETNMTGTWKHDGPTAFVVYACELLVGRRGFLGHNFPVLLAFPAVVLAVRRRVPELPLVAFAVCWSVGTWLLYAAGSNNHAGVCCSVRWLVPLLGPAFYLVALLLREREAYLADFAWLALCGLPLSLFSWWNGPWTTLMPPGMRALQIAALAGWALIRWHAWRRASAPVPSIVPLPQAA